MYVTTLLIQAHTMLSVLMWYPVLKTTLFYLANIDLVIVLRKKNSTSFWRIIFTVAATC